jgi:hypothetical protein
MVSSIKPSHRLLDPQDRIAEVLFGLIMALTITNSIEIAQQGEADVGTLIAGAIGCNLAWGVIDAAMYLMAQFGDRGRAFAALRGARDQSRPGEARQIIAAALPPLLASLLHQDELEALRTRLSQLPEVAAERPRLTRDDWLASVGVFLLVFLSTLPVVVPFVFVDNVRLALRISNAVAIALLFLCGWALGRYSGSHPWRVGLSMVLVGLALVAIAIALGG